jgi:ArsR family transcriptional regulator
MGPVATAAVGAKEALTSDADGLTTERALEGLRGLADPIRLRVVQALAGGERCVCELTAELGLAQSRLSFHLRVLREAGLIEARQQGRWMYYRLRPQSLEPLAEWLRRMAPSGEASAA